MILYDFCFSILLVFTNFAHIKVACMQNRSMLHDNSEHIDMLGSMNNED